MIWHPICEGPRALSDGRENRRSPHLSREGRGTLSDGMEMTKLVGRLRGRCPERVRNCERREPAQVGKKQSACGQAV